MRWRAIRRARPLNCTRDNPTTAATVTTAGTAHNHDGHDAGHGPITTTRTTRTTGDEEDWTLTTTADGVGLQFAQLIVSARSDHEAAMRFLAEHTEWFRVSDLPGLNSAQQVELARSLIMSGFLVRPPDDAAPTNP